MGQLIYLVEDDENIRELVRCTLESASFSLTAFETAEELFRCLEGNHERPDLILLDIMLPGIDGLEALKKLRASPGTEGIPVVMLTAKNSELDKVKGLDRGADDYIGKPFGVLELTARVRAVLRRGNQGGKPDPEDIISGKDLKIDLRRHRVSRATDGKEESVELTLKEFQLLEFLAQNRDRVVPREELLNQIWGIDFAGETRTLDMHIKSLRAKLADSPDNPRYIKTIRGVGYFFLS